MNLLLCALLQVNICAVSPLDPAQRHTPLFDGYLPGDHRVFSLQPFSVQDDIPAIYEWPDGYSSHQGRRTIAPVQHCWVLW